MHINPGSGIHASTSSYSVYPWNIDSYKDILGKVKDLFFKKV